MLIFANVYESAMPLSFWGEALSSFIHVHNRVTTTALPDSTPYESFLSSSLICQCFVSGAAPPTSGKCHLSFCTFSHLIAVIRPDKTDPTYHISYHIKHRNFSKLFYMK